MTEAAGTGTVESFTVIYGRGNEIAHGVVMLRTPDNARTLARVPAHDRQTLAHLLDMDRSPIGSSGAISRADDGMLEWRKREVEGRGCPLPLLALLGVCCRRTALGG